MADENQEPQNREVRAPEPTSPGLPDSHPAEPADMEEIAMPWEEDSSPVPLELPAEQQAASSSDFSGDQEDQDVGEDSTGAGDPKPNRPFDPVAAFLSTQSVSSTPCHSFPDEGEEALHEELHDEFQDEGEPEEPEPMAARRYRRHPLVRVFNFLCWCLLLSFLAGATAGFFYYRYARERLYSTQPGPARQVDVVIQSGDSYRRVIRRLEEAGLLSSYMGIDDAYLMRFLGWYRGNSSRIRHGSYRFDSTASLSDIYEKLLKGSQDFKLTVPEGLTVQQVAELAARTYQSVSVQRFVELTQDQKFITSLGMYVPALEGYLLPGTYYFGPKVTEEKIIRQMVMAFRKAAEEHLAGIEKKDDFNFHEHVIMASLIEREARVDEDRPLIASVIFNRLRKGMKLEIDATVNYALNEWRRLTHADLKVDSPFNTYRIKGLPPAPICNPRIESLVATYTAPASEYLFYVHRGDGRHVFARTFEEHQKNVREYITNRSGSAASEEKAETQERKSQPREARKGAAGTDKT